MNARALVVVNPAAGAGSALAGLSAVRPHLHVRFRHRVVGLDSEGTWKHTLRAALAHGVRLVIAAGGDGTVHAVANALHAVGAPADVVLGAIGLGSSNDFHKPVRETIAGIPVRLDAADALPRDLTMAHWTGNGARRSEVVLVSASVGVVARANAFFNDGDWLLKGLKRCWTGGAIGYAALNTIARRSSVDVRLEHPTGSWTGAVASLSVLETPHLSGSLRFDLPASARDGAVTVAIIEESSRPRLVARLVGLQRGRFHGRPRTWHEVVPWLDIDLGRPCPLELDGEVRVAERVRFEVLKARILTCP